MSLGAIALMLLLWFELGLGVLSRTGFFGISTLFGLSTRNSATAGGAAYANNGDVAEFKRLKSTKLGDGTEAFFTPPRLKGTAAAQAQQRQEEFHG